MSEEVELDMRRQRGVHGMATRTDPFPCEGTHEGKKVLVLRGANRNDGDGFDASKPQVLCQAEDGSYKIVLASEITVTAPKREPEPEPSLADHMTASARAAAAGTPGVALPPRASGGPQQGASGDVAIRPASGERGGLEELANNRRAAPRDEPAPKKKGR